MPGMTRCGIDTAGGIIFGGGQAWVRLDGFLVSVVGDLIAPHGSSPHGSAVMAIGSTFVFIDGEAVVHAGDVATCGHFATGSDWVTITP